MNTKNYLKMFEDFSTTEERYIMYTPTMGGYEMTTTAISTEDMMEEDAAHSAEHPIRIWYQFDLKPSGPGGGTLINKRIVKGPPNDPKYYENPEFEFDTPNSGIESTIDDEPSISSVDIHSPSPLDRDDSYLKTFRSSAGDLR